MAVLQHEGIRAGGEVMPHIGQGLRDEVELALGDLALRVLLQHQAGDAEAAHQLGIGRHGDHLAGHLREGQGHGRVLGDTTLQDDVLADGPVADDPVEVVRDDGEDQSRDDVGTLGALPAERGYTEELEHWAWCIRNRSPENLPRCHPKVAMGDAVIALTTNLAARQGARIEFKETWFDVHSDETPEGVKPDVTRYK